MEGERMNDKRIEIDGSFEEYKGTCPICQNTELFYYKEVHPHIGAYCVFDDTFLGWVRQWNEANWKRVIKERAKYTCERCGALLSGREAQAHHKLPQWFMPELKFDVNNGICLCRACHKQIHGKGGTIKEGE